MSEHDDGVPLRTSASGRVPQWVLDEAAGRTPVGVTGRDWFHDQPPPPPPRKRRRGRMLLTLVVVVAVVTGVLLYDRSTVPGPAAVATAPPVPEQVATPGRFPTPGVNAAAEPLGSPPAAPDSDAYAFVTLQEDGAGPVAYDPCRPVEVVVSLDGAPDGAEALVQDAVTRMQETTGLRFDYQGTTDELPSAEREVFQPDRYGDRWAPVLVGWRTPEQLPALAGDVAGLGGSAWAAPAGGTRVYVSGNVTLDGPEFGSLVDTDRGAAVARSIVLHELGHVVGLQHVWDTSQLMYATTDGEVLDFADGDLAGLARLGAGACVTQL